ncbi:Lipoprotein-releasing system transmembrane protein LolC [Thalassoglobus neptunius]|uniref:Lipoprotein-releasing system transmembrane protein LolC n=1 Tax=Thalassoglobus neptunius TaxID=1938619 RepID=A0A5C5WP73_9PLAN|nr:FtsX-like permease family protein [Thalassoglobus neptunius]TWT52045.1 Lipoprotein-releasing system transmembrane protein LolC [Thalassoglobus neptunius]
MYKFLIANRYLRTRLIALASIISVTLGVATMIVVNSVMSGFSSQMKDRIHAILADVMIETTNTDGTPDPRQLMADVERLVGAEVEFMTPTVEIYGMISFDWGGQTVYRPVTLIGIDPNGKNHVSPFAGHMMSRQKIILDDELIRGRLRDPNEPLDWELTDDARATRKDWIEFENFRDQFDNQYGNFESPVSAPPELLSGVEAAPAIEPVSSFSLADPFDDGSSPEIQQVSGSSVDGSQENDSTANGSSANGSSISHERHERLDGTGGIQSFRDPFESTRIAEQINPMDPLPARIYVGAGLVSFPYKDKATGKTKMIYMVKPGQDVTLTTIKTGKPEPASFKATVVDFFKSGMSEYDSNLVFCNLEQLQLARGMLFSPDPSRPNEGLDWRDGAVTSLQLKLKNYNSAGDVVRKLRSGLSPHTGTFQVLTWEQKQGPLLEAVAMESAILNVLLFLIITVAGFGILAIFFMIVVEKTRDIGILKALGASSRGVMFIFLSYGLSLGIVGSGVGVVLGLLFVRYINQVEAFLSWFTGRKVFDETIYYFREIPTLVSPMMVFWVALGAIVIAVLASVLPARRAARLHPVQALRYE